MRTTEGRKSGEGRKYTCTERERERGEREMKMRTTVMVKMRTTDRRKMGRMKMGRMGKMVSKKGDTRPAENNPTSLFSTKPRS